MRNVYEQRLRGARRSRRSVCNKRTVSHSCFFCSCASLWPYSSFVRVQYAVYNVCMSINRIITWFLLLQFWFGRLHCSFSVQSLVFFFFFRSMNWRITGNLFMVCSHTVKHSLMNAEKLNLSNGNQLGIILCGTSTDSKDWNSCNRLKSGLNLSSRDSDFVTWTARDWESSSNFSYPEYFLLCKQTRRVENLLLLPVGRSSPYWYCVLSW